MRKPRKALRALLTSGDTGEHVVPDKVTLAEWAKGWIAIGAPGRRRQRNGRRTVERYEELLRCHVLPVLGDRRLQQLQSTDIDDLYVGLEGKLAARTVCHVHFGARRLPECGGAQGGADHQPDRSSREGAITWRERSRDSARGRSIAQTGRRLQGVGAVPDSRRRGVYGRSPQ
jgi:Phage integrase, N-terminal SAM-like domain